MVERWGTPPEVIDVPLAGSLIDFGPLDRFLRSHRAPAGAMLLPKLDGFLTGIAVGPELIMPTEWMPIIWGEEDPAFDSFDEMQTVFGTVLSRYHEIVSGLRQDPPVFEPVFGTTKTARCIAEDWASGFIYAVGLTAPAWMPLIQRNEGKLLLLPILLLLPEEEATEIKELELFRDPEMRAAAIELIPDVVIEIDAFWQLYRTEPRPRKTGRNARCPCGSGRKYKHCCAR